MGCALCLYILIYIIISSSSGIYIYIFNIPPKSPRLEIKCSRLHTDRNTSQKKMGLLAWFALLMSDDVGWFRYILGEVGFDLNTF